MNNEIEKFLKEENARLTYGGRWVVWSDSKWVVLKKVDGNMLGKELYRGDSLADALKALKGE